jgi:hypothetical protein
MSGKPVGGGAAPPWRWLSASVRGAAHHRTGLPNQDAVRVGRCPLPGTADGVDAPALVLSLADGHGSARSFRSREGARLAVAIALRTAAHLSPAVSPLQRKRWAEEQWPLELVRGWQHAVGRRLDRRPFTAAELAPLDAPGRQTLEAHPTLAYGSTLLSVIVTPAAILYFQLGDGDLLTVAPDGSVVRPLPPDARLLGNETTSLCAPRAADDARVYCQTLAGAPPALILAASDGYANAFRDDAGFLQVARDLWDLLGTAGEAAVRPHLRGWLEEASRQGSGDDISVAILWRGRPIGPEDL